MGRIKFVIDPDKVRNPIAKSLENPDKRQRGVPPRKGKKAPKKRKKAKVDG